MAAGIADWAKKVGVLWLAGFREGACLHRVFFFFKRSRPLTVRTGQCFLLNGLIFLGSIYILNSVVIPTLHWILPDHCKEDGLQNACSVTEAPLRLYHFLNFILIQLFYILWFYPLYVFSYILSIIWYNDIAKHALASMTGLGPCIEETASSMELSSGQPVSHTSRLPGFGGVIIGIGEQIYSILLLSIFFVEVYATAFLPYVGKAVNFLLLSWIYAYYCFEYKWNFIDLKLEKRLDFFESNWAFFAGFGSPCVMATFFFSPLLSSGVMATLYPLFVLMAIGTQAEQVINSHRKLWGGRAPGKLPIFYAADTLAMFILHLFTGAPNESQKEDN